MLLSIYDAGPGGKWTFLFVTVVLGGLAAFVSGRAIADTWRPRWQIPLYMLMLAAGVRFVQFSVLGAPLLTLPSYLIDCAILTASCVAGYTITRSSQMAHQYGWTSSPDHREP